jgi:hypothetical protein
MTNRVSHNFNWLEPLMREFYAQFDKDMCFEAVIFRCGTLVRVEDDDECHKRFTAQGFNEPKLDAFLRDDFPSHRYFEPDYDAVKAENTIDWLWSQHQRPPHIATACARAYGCLMRSGYPLPGGIGGDRITLPPITGDVYSVVFQHLGACCATLVHNEHGDSIAAIDALGADMRRTDYMMPKPYAYVDKLRNITIL